MTHMEGQYVESRPPAYVYLPADAVQVDPEIKPEAAEFLKGAYHAFRAVASERWRQQVKWGDQSGHPDLVWHAILGEEVGEVAQVILHDKFGGSEAGNLRAELVQVAAVAIAWLEALDRREEATCAVCGDGFEGHVDPTAKYNVHPGCGL